QPDVPAAATPAPRSRFSGRPIIGYVRDQPFFKRQLLRFPRSIANVHQEPIYVQDPYKGVVVQAARQGPVRVKAVDFEQLADGGRFGRPCALADTEMGVDVGQAHVRVWLLSSRKLTQPIVRTMPLAQTFGLPRPSGEGRLQASFSASSRQYAAYSSLRCTLQKPSIRLTMASSASATVSCDGGFFAARGLGTGTLAGASCLG